MDTGECQAGWQYGLVQVDSGCGDGVSVTIICNGKRIIVSFQPSESLDGTIEGPLITRYEAACQDEDEDEEDAAQQEIDDMIYTVGKPIFARLASPIAKNLLYPETIFMRSATINGKAGILEQEHGSHPEQNHPPPPLQINNDLGLPKFSSNDIQVLENFMGQGEITRVLVDGQERCCKSGGPFNWEAVAREADCLWKVARSEHALSIRVPKLTGLVTSADNGQTIGILEEYIPTDLKDLSTLRDVDTAIIDLSRRKKWSSQIREMVHLMHEIGVVWGNGKPRNVLIHKDTDDAWLIDFGGGWTDGWVDEDLKETREGDEQSC
ncbi:Uncharacterized protein BP5553_03491 [Venustampulla echinocandica]|uniref:Protein kinase domain-containing protein n=1 Tax=Venustampulla echinocandica TaxID=2656787 RepID=A0A370TUE6_9HELO|nr:Uncharacterized protein BP5553_03491 [Venustampulla echinocandica]RDL39151.1 Uncharacterized protein BP5553_03491 [Venustampulla echinocandica]